MRNALCSGELSPITLMCLHIHIYNVAVDPLSGGKISRAWAAFTMYYDEVVETCGNIVRQGDFDVQYVQCN